MQTSPSELRRGRERIRLQTAGDLAGACCENDTTAMTATGLQTSGGTVSSFSLTLVAVYGYDPMNRRLVRIVAGEGDYRYAYDGWRELEELTPVDQGGVMVARAKRAFVWGAGLDELVGFWEENGGTWVDSYALQDEQGSVTGLLAGASGAVREWVEYDPYGKPAVIVPGGGAASANPYRRAGHRLDAETGLYYVRNRYLHAELGRFLTLDPIGEWSDGANLGNGYGFVGNNPGSRTDPSGLLSLAPGFSGVPDWNPFAPPSDRPPYGSSGERDVVGGASLRRTRTPTCLASSSIGASSCQDPSGRRPQIPPQAVYGPLTLEQTRTREALVERLRRLPFTVSGVPVQIVDGSALWSTGEDVPWVDLRSSARGSPLDTSFPWLPVEIGTGRAGTADRPYIAFCRGCSTRCERSGCNGIECVLKRILVDYRRRLAETAGDEIPIRASFKQVRGPVIAHREGVLHILAPIIEMSVYRDGEPVFTARAGGHRLR